ncbi:MAG: protein-glutamate O-methyltransferase CheR [Desulfobacteraceae bacterium]|nr:MAG: protein-glutamate O-methyltransferase CheR [Desulfobacteraceae bacterium]
MKDLHPSGVDLSDIEIRLLLEGIFLFNGFDFRDYDPEFVRARVARCMNREGVSTVSELQNLVLHDPACMERFVQSFAMGPGKLFHQPGFFSVFRNRAIALLRALPSVRMWVAGCENGAETYSVAILLKENGLFEKTTLYSTLMSESALRAAEKGLIPACALNGRANEYRMAGGKKTLTGYFAVRKDYAWLAGSLRTAITWSQFDMVSGASFNQFHCIFSRKVIGRLRPEPRQKVHKLLYESLALGGILGLGELRDMNDNPYACCYEPVDGRLSWYRKTS